MLVLVRICVLGEVCVRVTTMAAQFVANMSVN